jgi:hypothetical protein
MRRGTAIALFLTMGVVSILSLGGAQSAGNDQALAKVLDLARKYCARLDKAALDFVCMEQVKEESNSRRGPDMQEHFNTLVWVYDYQFVRKEGKVTEKRDLVKKNGEEIEKKEARIETRHFKFNDIFFGASILLGEAAAADHVYKFVENDKIQREPVVVVACEAKPASAGKVLTGRAWVRERDGAVLRISWAPASFGDYQNVLVIAEDLGMNPAIISETEFGVERNGIRFPSRDWTEETYRKGTMSFTRSMITVTYDNYKFFTVETGVEIK